MCEGVLANVHLPSFAVLRCFDSAARHQSFTTASEELGLSQSAVSRHVRELESHIGVALFRREGRGVRLTIAGQSLARRLSSDLGALRRTISHSIAAGESAQVLTIAVLPTFGARWLVPRLRKFTETKPNLELVVFSRSEPFDLVEQGVDLAVHFGTEEWPGARLTKMCEEDLVAVASPDLCAEFGSDDTFHAFEFPLLHLSSRPHLWEAFKSSVSETEVPARAGSYFDQFSLIISAAVAGLGAAILPTYLIEKELEAGSLIEIARPPVSIGRNYYLATPAGIKNSLVSEFIFWARKQVRNP